MEEVLEVEKPLVEAPVIRSYVEHSPEDSEEACREAFFHHHKHIFIITTAGKPIYTRYHRERAGRRHGEEGGVSAICAALAATIPKLQTQYYDQSLSPGGNSIR